MKEQIDHQLNHYLSGLAEIPNAPFIYGPSLRFVMQSLDKLGISNVNPERAPNHDVAYCVDELALYLRIKRGNPQNKLIITTHLDHPFLVINNNGTAEPVGSVHSERLLPKTPLRIYSQEGEFLGIDFIKELRHSKLKTTIKLTGEAPSSSNSQGLWDLKPIIHYQNTLKMLSADDIATTAVCLSVIENLMKKEGHSLNVEFVFTKVEEVRQVSATGIAIRGGTPFGKIDSSTIVVPLECDYVRTSKRQRDLITANNFKLADYESGIILRLNDNGIVYGQAVAGENKAESLILSALYKESVSFQQSLVGSACDGTPFTLFTNTPSIACITIPTRYKHNYGSNGEIVHEEIKLKDLLGLKKVLTKIAQISGEERIVPLGGELAPRLKVSPLVADKKAWNSLLKDRKAAFYSSIERLKRGRYYPNQLSDKIYFIMGGISSRIKRLIK